MTEKEQRLAVLQNTDLTIINQALLTILYFSLGLVFEIDFRL